MMKAAIAILMASLSLMLIAFLVSAQPPTDSTRQISEVKMKITSPAFKEGEVIPVKYTCDGEDVSPALVFSDVPAGTKTLTMICNDPDAPVGDWVHWIIYNMPPDIKHIPENVIRAVSAIVKIDGKEIALQHGKTDFGRYGYGGPCPPRGSPHRYYFKLYALDFKIDFSIEDIKSGVTKKILLDRMKGHVLAEASLMGKYQRK